MPIHIDKDVRENYIADRTSLLSEHFKARLTVLPMSDTKEYTASFKGQNVYAVKNGTPGNALHAEDTHDVIAVATLINKLAECDKVLVIDSHTGERLTYPPLPKESFQKQEAPEPALA